MALLSLLGGSSKHSEKGIPALLHRSANRSLSIETAVSHERVCVTITSKQHGGGDFDVAVATAVEAALSPQALEDSDYYQYHGVRVAPVRDLQEGEEISEVALHYKGETYATAERRLIDFDWQTNRLVASTLMPKSNIENDPSGTPEHIVKTSFEEFQAFVERSFTPSGMRMVFWE